MVLNHKQKLNTMYNETTQEIKKILSENLLTVQFTLNREILDNLPTDTLVSVINREFATGIMPHVSKKLPNMTIGKPDEYRNVKCTNRVCVLNVDDLNKLMDLINKL